ncbi:Cvm1p [Lachancea thermotolerans CBS 6340]|uniref:KLTH0F10010p n=1 Tax=Lachancea thermotolerans (strain ATCC 56472 / CBS 6340 / NRRL Y-8284) TaxID=559295 RepID=C5DL51_LACTC|nr:KLTH0F10010p [Lachancea thermotolerans CBS 6340]CAR24202.1 KLTH0F10010p [Lachancea thermotolerans CBS 6340]
MTEESPNAEGTDHDDQNSTWAKWMSAPLRGFFNQANNNGTNPEESKRSDEQVPTPWLSGLAQRLPSFSFPPQDEAVDIKDLADYANLNAKQIQLLELEAQQGIVKKADTWCWFEDITSSSSADLTLQQPGELSVYNTGSSVCPLPLTKFPISKSDCPRFMVENSTLLPNTVPEELYHERNTFNKVVTAFRNYYNFPSERHTYLRSGPAHSRLKEKKVVVISFVGNLPDRYRKITLGKMCSARHLSLKLSASLKDFSPQQVLAFSLEVPLDQKPLEECFEECTQLLKNWRHQFDGTCLLLFNGLYHSVPLQIMVAKRMLEDAHGFGMKQVPSVGLLCLESCLGGYQFWDHSSDITIDPASANYQANREKVLFQGCTRIQQEILSQISEYKDLNSPKSKQVREALDWLFQNCASAKLVLMGKLYESFMTVGQKLAIDYQHPNIIRHVWLSGSDLGMDLKKADKFLPTKDEFSAQPFFHQRQLDIPKDRLFEICLIRDLITAVNLGYEEAAIMTKMISPFFISRSFNQHTLPATLKKQQQYELKAWLQEMDLKWKTFDVAKDGGLPAVVGNVADQLEYILYKATRQSPEHIKIKSGMFEDSQVYSAFVLDIVKTTTLLEPRKLAFTTGSAETSSILSSRSQYDLVWQLHSFFSFFTDLRNLPEQTLPKLLFLLSRQPASAKLIDYSPTRFRRTNDEALSRLRELWEVYHDWKPPTKALKQLQRILSFLSLYPSSVRFQSDMNRTKC